MTQKYLRTADRWILAGNLLAIAGSTLVGIGTVLKLASGSGLPNGKPIFPNFSNDEGTIVSASRVQDSFNIYNQES